MKSSIYEFSLAMQVTVDIKKLFSHLHVEVVYHM